MNDGTADRPILVVDDEAHFLNSIDITLKSGGWPRVVTSRDARLAGELIEAHDAELLLLDLMMPGVSGEEILAETVRRFPDVPVIMITGVNEVDTAVRCMKQGAFDYILKPVEPDRLITAVKRAADVRRLRRENSMLRRRLMADGPEHPEFFSEFITQNRKMMKIFQYCEAVAPGRYPILITGETGAGKELIARILHKLSRRRGELVVVNVAGLDDNVFSDALFGHVRGAYTGADRPRSGLVKKADGGTLLLDEIGDLKEASQIKLLRLLEQKEYYPLGSDVAWTADVRFLFSTHRDMESLQETGRFRADLYYRLQTHHIHIPPLRERPDDIPLLFDHFLDAAAREFGANRPAYSPETLEALRGYAYPGNVRELRAIIHDIASRHPSDVLTPEMLPPALRTNAGPPSASTGSQQAGYGQMIKELEALPSLKESADMLVREAMRRSGQNQRAAAALLGVTPQALNQRLKRGGG